MNAYDFYSPEDIDRAARLGSLGCELKKLRTEGFVSMFSSTMDRYYRFFGRGRYLVYYDSKPKFDQTPKNVMLIDEVEKVELESKATDFAVYLKDGKSFKLRHDDPAVVENWIRSLSELKEFYKPIPFITEEARRKYKDKIDPTTTIYMLEELERRL